jgi:hypothetical protein
MSRVNSVSEEMWVNAKLLSLPSSRNSSNTKTLLSNRYGAVWARNIPSNTWADTNRIHSSLLLPRLVAYDEVCSGGMRVKEVK